MRLSVFTLPLLVWSGLVAADIPDPEAFLLDALEETSTLATRTKMNIDDLPSTVTVLHSEELSRMGVLTLHEALGLLPGVEATRAQNGWRMINMRGITTPNTFGFDKVKLLIDGVDVTSQLYGTVYYYLDLPVELIERIEVLRGPASAIYGAGAFTGAINVITKLHGGEEGSNAFVRGGNLGSAGAGATGRWQKESWAIGLDAWMQQDRPSVEYPQPEKKDGTPHSGAWGGTSHHGFDDKGAAFVIEKGGLKLHGRIKEAAYENQIGDTVIPAVNDERKNNNRHSFIELVYEAPKINGFGWQFKGGERAYEFNDRITAMTRDQVYEKIGAEEMIDGAATALADQLMTQEPFATLALMDAATARALAEEIAYRQAKIAIDGNITADGVVEFYSRERTRYGELSASYEGFNNHQLLTGLSWEQSENLDNYVISNYDLAEIEETVANPGQQNWAELRKYEAERGLLGLGSHRRTITALWLQDLISIGERLDLALGGRWDAYGDLDKTLPSWRAGGVYRLNDTNRIKLMSGEAFRAPSWVELYSQGARELIAEGNTSLEPETIRTTELSFQRKLSGQGNMAATLFQTTVYDPIDADGASSTYQNYPDRHSQGVELEYHQSLSPSHRLDLTLARIWTRGDDLQPYTDEEDAPIAEVAHKQGNLSHTWFMTANVRLTSHVQYLAGRIQSKIDQEVDETVVVNETLAYRLSPQSRLTLRVANLFDRDTVIPSFNGYHLEGTPQPGRRTWLTLEQRF